MVNHDAYRADCTKKVTKDSIYNLMSMTKPVLGVVIMTFFGKGRFKLDDLVSKILTGSCEPQSGLERVLRNDDGVIFEPLRRLFQRRRPVQFEGWC